MTQFADLVGKLHDAVDLHLGEAASFETPTAAPVSCKALLDAPDIVAGLIEAKGVVGDAVIRVRMSAIPRPRKGDRFVLGARVFDVVAPGERELPNGDVWMVKVLQR